MELKAMRQRIEQLESEIEHKNKQINRLKMENMELQFKHDKLYENLERFVGNDTVGNYYKHREAADERNA